MTNESGSKLGKTKFSLGGGESDFNSGTGAEKKKFAPGNAS